MIVKIVLVVRDFVANVEGQTFVDSNLYKTIKVALHWLIKASCSLSYSKHIWELRGKWIEKKFQVMREMLRTHNSFFNLLFFSNVFRLGPS